MAAELVNAATTEKLVEIDWMKHIAICELVAQDHRQARDVVKAIKKRLSYKKPNTQLYAVMLLEMLMNNIGDDIHQQVIDTEIIPILVKIVKKKTDFPVRERIFLLLDAAQTSLGGASGKFPQYYTAYYDLVSAGVQFNQRARVVQLNRPSSQPNRTNNVPNRERALPTHGEVAQPAESQTVPGSSIIQKASDVLEVLKEVLDAVDAQHSQGGRDEFTLDLVEQCSFQKQRVMHLVMASRDERIVSRAIELNEQLQQVLARHDDMLSAKATTTANHFGHEDEKEEPEQLSLSIIQKASDVLEVLKEVLDAVDAQHSQGGRDEFTLDLVEQCSFQKQRVMHLVMASRDERIVSRAIELNEQLQQVLTRHDDMLSAKATTTANHFGHEDEEEEPEQLLLRLRKGKARARPEDEEAKPEFPCLGLLEERLNRPIIRPLSLSPSRLANAHPAPSVIPPPSARQNSELPHVAIPPPPAKHIERERYFQENKKDGATLAGHSRGLSLNSYNGSSSYSGSLDFSSDWSI